MNEIIYLLNLILDMIKIVFLNCYVKELKEFTTILDFCYY